MRSSDQLLTELKSLHPRLIDLSLGRIEHLLARMGSPHLRLPPTIIIAGTNGKGSVTAYLKAILEAASKRVHVYTSPHLVRFTERISLAGADGRSRPISEEGLVDQLERVAKTNAGDEITFFEITTAAAFQAFAEHPADAILLEVGLGGRLDATNVVPRPALTVITPVSMDHMDKLGETLGLIAREKAGILKPGVQAVIARQEDAGLDVIRAEARRVQAPLAVWGEDYESFAQGGRLVYQDGERLLDLPIPGLFGQHQIENAGVAIASALRLADLKIPESALERGLVEVQWPARMQRLANGPLSRLLKSPASELWLDGGHNVAGATAIAHAVGQLEERAPKPLALVLGMMGQKDARGFLEHFRGLARRIVTVAIPGAHERPFDPKDLAALARSLGFVSAPAASLEAAIEAAQAGTVEPMRILVCGSLYLAGHVLAKQDGLVVQGN